MASKRKKPPYKQWAPTIYQLDHGKAKSPTKSQISEQLQLCLQASEKAKKLSKVLNDAMHAQARLEIQLSQMLYHYDKACNKVRIIDGHEVTCRTSNAWAMPRSYDRASITELPEFL